MNYFDKIEEALRLGLSRDYFIVRDKGPKAIMQLAALDGQNPFVVLSKNIPKSSYMELALAAHFFEEWDENDKINVVEEKKGFFNKLFADSTTLELKLESERLKLPLVIKLKLKKDAFVRAFDKSDDRVIPGTIAEGSVDKFIKYLLGQSKWAKELKEALPDIDKKLTKESFE